MTATVEVQASGTSGSYGLVITLEDGVDNDGKFSSIIPDKSSGFPKQARKPPYIKGELGKERLRLELISLGYRVEIKLPLAKKPLAARKGISQQKGFKKLQPKSAGTIPGSLVLTVFLATYMKDVYWKARR